jgi:hypothetical protein
MRQMSAWRNSSAISASSVMARSVRRIAINSLGEEKWGMVSSGLVVLEW